LLPTLRKKREGWGTRLDLIDKKRGEYGGVEHHGVHLVS
jgi:hypothetical protein